MSMALIPTGKYTLGGNDGVPKREINIDAFEIETVAVSNELWKIVYSWAIKHGYQFDGHPSTKGPQFPAANMNWFNATKWCNARSELEGLNPSYYTTFDDKWSAKTVYRKGQFDLSDGCVDWRGNGYRLPVGDEWEAAARDGKVGLRFPWGDTIDHIHANYFGTPGALSYDLGPGKGYNPLGGKSNPRTVPVMLFPQTKSGLCNIVGNVGQWTWDKKVVSSKAKGRKSTTYRYHRGGMWSSECEWCRLSALYPLPQTSQISDCGMRCVKSK
jgi:formylglycine-generating enzyme required for sulfatase activity